jgi:hypothetical protein
MDSGSDSDDTKRRSSAKTRCAARRVQLGRSSTLGNWAQLHGVCGRAVPVQPRPIELPRVPGRLGGGDWSVDGRGERQRYDVHGVRGGAIQQRVDGGVRGVSGRLGDRYTGKCWGYQLHGLRGGAVQRVCGSYFVSEAHRIVLRQLALQRWLYVSKRDHSGIQNGVVHCWKQQLCHARG